MEEEKTTRQTYAELARITQASFEDRRKIEWRINFSLWTALGIIVYWFTNSNETLFRKWPEALGWGITVFIAYISALFLIAFAHAIDKDWKHYYMDKSEGINAIRPSKENPKWPDFKQYMWIMVYGILTLSLILFTLRCLVKYNESQMLGWDKSLIGGIVIILTWIPWIVLKLLK